MNRKLYAVFIFITCCLSASYAQEKLSIEQIMQGHEFVGHLPENPFWSEDGKKIYFDWNPSNEPSSSLYFISVANGKAAGKPQKVSAPELREMPSQGGVYNRDHSQKLYAKNGDLFLYEISTGKKRQITNTIDREHNATFNSDETAIFYQNGNNIFRWNIAEGSLTQLTDFQSGSPRKGSTSATHEQWLEDQQMQLIRILKEREKDDEFDAKQRRAVSTNRPKRIYLKGKNIDQIRISPDGNYVVYRLSQSPAGATTIVPDFTTETGYTEDLTARAKVGSPQTSYQLWVYDVKKEEAREFEMSQLEGIRDTPAYFKDYARKQETDRKIRPVGTFWSADGQYAVAVLRAMDSKDRWLVSLDCARGSMKSLDRQHDDAWVGGPGIGTYGYSAGNVGFLPDNEHFYFQSEKNTGFSHLYTLNLKTGNTTALTSGKFEVSEAALSRDGKAWYLTTNQVHTGEFHFYKMPLKGGKMTQLTSQTGRHSITLSPDEQYMLDRFSYSNKPWELYLSPTKAKANMTQLTDSQSDSFKKHQWVAPEIISFEARDKAEVQARIYRPENPEKQGKAVIFVHGAGYLQNVHKGWSTYFREYMFHHFLVQNGYTVLDIDYRGSSGYGRDWRTGIYRHMGGKDLTDQVDGAKMLAERYDIDPKRIGIYGGSYGGFITLMAMFNEAETFKAGAALRSVTDWAHYNHPYTANILNTPVLDKAAYERSSPIYFAEGLKGDLLICHGMVDTNVHFQDVVRLAQRLIELKKENWEFAVYPVEGHGFVEPSSWNDEYSRIFKLFERSLK